MAKPDPVAAIPKPCISTWPDHPWDDPDDDGHNCTGCAPDSVWKCDRAGHRIGDWLREQDLPWVKP